MSHEKTISSIQPSQPRKRQPHSLAFWRRLCLCWFLSLTLGGLPLMPPAAKAEVRPSVTEKPAANASTPPPAVQGNVDLSVTALDTATIVTDSQTLVISGSLGVTINNLGSDAINAAFRVIAFEDRNSNGAFDQGTDLLLGSTDFPSGVAANGNANLSIALSGIVAFKGNVIYVWVDSQNAIAETNEANNLRNTGQNSNVSPPAGLLNPIVKWSKSSFTVRPESNQVIMAPAVIDLNADGIPDIVFSTFEGSNYLSNGLLRAISGAGGGELWTVTNASYELQGAAGIAVGDIDNDGRPEIIATSESRNLIAFEHDGSFKWMGPPVPSIDATGFWGSASIADLDHDGIPEIIIGATVVNNDGSLRWQGNLSTGDNLAGPLSLIADLDLDGNSEIVAGKTAYRSNGSVYWNASLPSDGFPAVGNFDSDLNPEIVIVSKGNVYLLEHTGQIKWGPIALPGGGEGGAPTVADFDNDGQPEIGVAGATRYSVFETDGTLKWAVSIQDGSSQVTGSSVFDFNGDGSAEVIYGDELFLRIYRGTDGTELYRLAKSSCTAYELPVIADVDADGRAEIVAVANQLCGIGLQNGIYVIGGADNNWANTRRIWNQHAYYITNINENGTIPRNEQPNWLTPGLNNFRLNTFAPGEGNPTGAPDLTASFIRKNDAAYPSSSELTARIGNGGGVSVPANTKVSFYRGGPAAGGTLIGTTQTSSSLNPGQYEDVKVVWNSPPIGLHPITVVADDNGLGQGTVNEGNEANNKAMANIALGIGPFTLVDDLIARFKDSAVDLKWSPIVGAAGYNIYRRTGNNSPQLIKQNHPRANYADSSLTNGTTVYYTVRWVNANGIESGDGTEMSATPTSQNGRSDVPPTILSAPVTHAIANTPYAYDVSARDPNAADALSYSLPSPISEALRGITVNPASGLIQWTPNLAGAGYQNVTVRVEDSRGRFATQTYRLFVEIPNQPPVVNAGADQTSILAAGATLNGSALDDGLPFGSTLTTAWSKVSGPGTVTFANSGTAATTAAFSTPGSYVLRLTASDSQFSRNDEVTVLVVSQLASRIYTLNSDFDAGQYDNVVHSIPHQLQLPSGNSLVPTVPLNPVVKWQKDSFSVRPDLTSVRMTPAVIDLNGDQIPDIVFITGGYVGILRAISGADGSELWSVTDPAYLLTGDLGIAVGDIDNDGRPEIIAAHDQTRTPIAFEHDGTFKWQSTVPIWSACSIADLDHDGTPEIVCGATVLNNNGTLRWQRTGSGILGDQYSNVVDLDLDGNPEIVSGGKAYKADGTLLWNAGLDGWTAVGNFDADPYPEIVIVAYFSGSAYMLEHTGQVKWGPISIPSGRGGAPTVADVDGDGQPEIGIAAATSYTMFRADGSIKWQAPITDGSSAGCSSTIFDLNGDGIPEVIYGDEQFLRIFRGTDGFELGRVSKSSATGAEYPVVADVNGDGHAEIVVVAEGTQKGIIVIGGGDNNWRNARRIWNQYAYHITNINDDGTIPRYEQPNWLTPGLNNFCVNTAPSVNSGTWTVAFDSQIANAEWGRLNWNAQVCGDGALTVTAASSTDNTNFSSPQTVTRGADLTVPNGRYLRISVSFRRATTGESPVLYDLSVGTDGYMPQALANTAPVVDAGASQLIALPNPARLLPSVCDDTQPVNGTLASTWSKFSGPGTVTFANANALVTTATFSAAGTYVLRLTVNDGQFSASDDITIEVENNNRPPVIASQAVTNGYVGRPYAYQVIATDPNSGDVLSYSLPTAPAGMGINPITGLIQWTPVIGQIGSHTVRVVVTDAAGASAEQLYTITVTDPPPNQPPVIASTAPTGAAVEVPYTYAVIATDPDAGDVLTYSLDAAPAGMTINAATGLIQWFPLAAQVGNHNITVRVRDVSNATVTQSFTIAVIATVLEPTVAITSPAPGSNVTQLVNIVGDVTDPNNGAGPPLTWTLAYRRHDSTTYKTIGSGTGPVSNATVGQFDPTLLPNDVYYIRLQATKGIHIIGTEAPYNVMGDLKLGNFTVSFTDLTIPVAGIPIVITRSYDSLDTDTGEFGAGWRLGLAGKVRDTAREGVGDTFNTSTRVYVTRADGRRVGFTFAPEHIGGFFPMWRPVFRPDPGVTETLEAPDAYLFNSGGQFFDGFDVYNPDLYTFVTKEGVRYTIDEIQGLKKVTDTNGNTLDVTATGITSSTGVSVAFERDAQNRITKITEPAPAVGAPGELHYVYDANGNLTQFLDQMGNATKYSYGYAQFPNYLTKIEDPLNRAIARNVFDNQGRLIGLCDANGDPATLNGCVRLTPNSAGHIETIVNARGFRTDLILDDRGNVLTERRFLDGVNFLDTVRTYNANNNMLTETDPSNNTKSFTYDARGNTLTATDPGNRTTTYTYNATCNKVATVTDPASNVTAYEYDDKCNLRFVRQPLNRTTEHRYNARGQRTEMIDPVGSHWGWVYDGSGFLQSLTDPFSKATQFTFNGSGELLSRIDRNNRRIDFEYDAAHRPTKEKWNTIPQRITTYSYNAVGQLTSAVDPDSAVAIGYFNTGLVQSVDNAGTPGAPRVLISYSYDGNGNVTRVQDSLGGSTDYSYDALDRLSRVTQSGTGVNEKRVDMVYDEASFLRELRRFSNLAGTQGVANTFFDYDCGGCAGRVKSIHHRKASNNAVVHDMDFTRDVLGNIVSATDAEGVHSYTYDALRQLKTVVHNQSGVQLNELYSYDTAGNRLTSHLSSNYSYSYMNAGNGNRLLQDMQFNYQYDDEGNLIRRTERATGNYTEFAYDHRNRMNASVKRDQADIQQERADYVYDFADRRIHLNENGNVMHLIYDGLNPMLKMGSNGSLLNRRLYRPGIDLIIADEAMNSVKWFITDQTGTVRDLVSNDGTTLNHYTYDSFGRLLSQSNQAITNDIFFSAREFSLASELGYFRTRYYSPSIGRFQQQDIRTPYGYEAFNNNPLSFIDPMGTSAIPAAAFILSGALAVFQIFKTGVDTGDCVLEEYNSGRGNYGRCGAMAVLGAGGAVIAYIIPGASTFRDALTLGWISLSLDVGYFIIGRSK